MPASTPNHQHIGGEAEPSENVLELPPMPRRMTRAQARIKDGKPAPVVKYLGFSSDDSDPESDLDSTTLLRNEGSLSMPLEIGPLGSMVSSGGVEESANTYRSELVLSEPFSFDSLAREDPLVTRFNLTVTNPSDFYSLVTVPIKDHRTLDEYLVKKEN